MKLKWEKVDDEWRATLGSCSVAVRFVDGMLAEGWHINLVLTPDLEFHARHLYATSKAARRGCERALARLAQNLTGD